MKTPICDFAKKYSKSGALRLHMPGHKGKSFIGIESLDLTEFDGADCLFSASGIIKSSEQNASAIFGADTFYSTEGSSLSIRAMLLLCYKFAISQGKKPLILAGRNAHKSFLSALSFIDLKVEWLFGDDNYLSCNITAPELEKHLSLTKELPFALYLTCPDYLGNMVDIFAISKVCKKFGVLLLVDNAHGAYLNFLPKSLHPISLGADMCCDSAHKTLPALTGASYLHISKNAPEFFKENAKDAMSLFASTSPSYLILQSLDLVNAYLCDGYKDKLNKTITLIDGLKTSLINYGYSLVGDEPLKVCISTKPFGYTGEKFNELLKKHNIVCEFYDNDFVVFMITPEIEESDILRLQSVLTAIPKEKCVFSLPPKAVKPVRQMDIKSAIFAPSESVAVEDALGRVLSSLAVNCPPAVPIIVSGEVIDLGVVSALKYYGIKSLKVVK